MSADPPPNTSQPVSLRRSRVAIIVSLALLTGVGVIVLATVNEDRRLRGELLNEARIATAGLDLVEVGALSGAASDQDSEAYRRLKVHLAAVRRAVPSCRFAYLLGQRDDGFVFFYGDSEPRASVDCSPPGQIFGEVQPAVRRLFNTRRPLTLGPARDRWGTWISAFVPLLLPGSGQQVVVLGIDVQAREWLRLLWWRLAPALIATAVAVVLMVFFGLLSYRLRIEKWRLGQHASALQESESLFRDIAEQLRDAVFLTDQAARLTYVSPAVQTITGLPSEALRNHPLSTLFGGDDQTQEELLQATSAGADVSPREQSLDSPDGRHLRLEVSASPLRHGGAVVGMIGLVRDITERWQEARRIALSEARFSATFHHSPVAALITEEGSARVIDMNAAFSTLTGYTAASSDMPLHGIGIVRDDEERARLQAELAATGFVQQTATIISTAGGDTREVIFSAARIPVADRHCLLTRLQDLTQLRAVEASLRVQESYLRSIFRVAPVGIAVGTLDALSDANEAWLLGTGFSHEELVERGPRVLFASADEFEQTQRAIAEQLQEEGSARLEVRTRRKDGEMREVLLCATCTDPDKDPESITYACVDITERRRAERALQDSEERYRTIFNFSPAGIFLLRGGQHVFANTAGIRLLGYDDAAEVVGRPASATISLTDPRDHDEFLEAIRDDRPISRSGVVIRRADGAQVHADLTAVAIRLEDGPGLLLIGVDVSERRRAEESQRESRRIAWTLLNATEDSALLLDPEGVIQGANAGAAGALATPVAGLLGRRLAGLLPAEVAPRRLAQIERARDRRRPAIEVEERDGRTFSITVHPVVDDAGAVTALALFERDISELRRAEDAQRLASLGQLAAGVAHEFNNLLCAVAMHASLAHQVRSAETLDSAYESIREATARGSEICDSLLGFARPPDPIYSLVAASDPFEAALALTKPQLTSGQITVERDYDPLTPPLWADRSQLEQVYLNLIVNACHAMPEGGALRVRVRPDPQEPAAAVLIEVTDSGHGIAPEYLPHLFDPFFTTKGALGQSRIAGTGLGLSVSRGIILAHGGEIRAFSTLGRGATFQIRLPASVAEPASAAAAAPAAVAGEEALSGLRLLLVEDERAIREATAEFLAAVGVEAVVSGNADEAIALLRQQPFGVVVSDLMMPGGGLSVVRTVATMPEPPALLVITGRLNSQLERELLAAGANGVLAKPFGPAELLAAVQRLIPQPL